MHFWGASVVITGNRIFVQIKEKEITHRDCLRNLSRQTFKNHSALARMTSCPCRNLLKERFAQADKGNCV